MPKIKTSYFCQNCGTQSPKWIGHCTACDEWNTYVEEVVQKSETSEKPWRSITSSTHMAAKPIALEQVEHFETQRIITRDEELNRVLGGGIVPGSLTLIGGEPGIGKSTLLLQIALGLTGKKVLYVSGEESERQIKMRAERLDVKNPDCFILCETATQNIFKQLELMQPELVIIDSIQTLTSAFIESASGSVSQIRECTSELMKYSKETGTPVFLIGHITKDGSLAGPKVLEHMVDTVLNFEGDHNHMYRIVRTAKNRFGSTSELGIYEMMGTGLREVSNPSEILINQREGKFSGIAIGATLEGNRPLLIEVQALVTPAVYGTSQRSATGFDLRRMSMLLAVLEKRCNFKLGMHDVFLNIAGGLKIEDPAMDLAVTAAIVSSLHDLPIPSTSCLAAEIGLSGEIRPVNRLDRRVTEASKLGFTDIFLSKGAPLGSPDRKFDGKIKVHSFAKLEDVFGKLFGQ